MDRRLSLMDELVCCTDQPLSNFEQKFFTKLFQPILTTLSSNLYLTLHSLINYGELESKKITHAQICKSLNITDASVFLNARYELEALGLIETYLYEQDDTHKLYLIVLKRLPSSYEFFNDPILASLLKDKIGIEAFNEVASSYLIHLYDINKFDNITKSLDEVYYKTVENSDVSSFWINTNFNGVSLKKTHFDYELFVILVSALNILNKDVLESTTLYNNINRLAWMFDLDTEKIVEALKESVNDGLVDYDLLRANCKKMITSNNEIVLKKIESTNETGSKLVQVLNSITPSVLVENKYNTKLTPSEIEMFDKLLVTTSISVGVLNVLIIYVLETKNGEIPSFNYFLKIINTWIRKGVKTTEEALNLISTPSSTTKTKKSVSNWYQKYLEEVNTKKVDPTSSESLDELESFFNSKK